MEKDGGLKKQLLRVDEVATYFDVHPRTIRLWIEHGHLSGEKLSGVVRVTRESILDFRKKSSMV
jgi:excisionase family DNA binding protein